MTGLVRKATLLSAGGLLIAGTAMAGIPSPANCKYGTGPVDGARITIWDGGVNFFTPPSGVNSLPNQTLEIRDNGNAVIPNALVIIEATSDPFVNDGVGIDINCDDVHVEFCEDVEQVVAWIGSGAFAGPAESYQATTDGAGKLGVTIIGNGQEFTCSTPLPGVTTCASDDPAPPSRPKCAKVYADGGTGPIFLGKVLITNATFDLNEDGFVDAFDGAQFLVRRTAYGPGAGGNSTYTSEVDFDADGDNDAGDGAFMIAGINQLNAVPSNCVVIP